MTPAANVEAVETISDEALLRHYAERHDPSAFAELANRRAGLVFGVCLRITADRHDAEELTQDCFLQLARKAATIQTSVAGWLHQVATHRALNAVRSRGRRREREARAATTTQTETTETAWSEVEPLLDEAVDGLPADVREAIILHFLQSLSQETVARRMGVHQSTISRRIDRGLHLLRERLLARGVAMSAAPLSALLAAGASPPSAPNLAEAIGKIALAGAGSGGAGGLLGWLGLSWANVKAWASLVGAAVFPVLVQLMAGGWHGFLTAVLMMLYIAWRRPAWIEDLALSPGGRVYDNPFYPFHRWTWTTPPQNWRSRLFAALMAGIMMGCMALNWMLADRALPGMAAMFLLYAVILLSTAARIVIRVIHLGENGHREKPVEDAEPPVDAVNVVQSLFLVMVVPLMAACFMIANIRLAQPRSHTLALYFALAVSAVWGSVDSVRNLSRYRRARRAFCGVDRQAPPDGTKTSAPPPKSTEVALAFYMILAVYLTVPALFGALAFVDGTAGARPQHAAALGNLPPVSLLFLIISIRPLARIRATTRPALWRFAVAVAVLCAILNLGFCVVWLMPQA